MKRYFTIVQLALIVAIAYLGTFVFYRVMTDKLETVPIFQGAMDKEDPPKNPVVKKRTASFQKYQAAIDRNLFGAVETEVASKNEKVDVKDLEQTQLGLKLWGTVFGVGGKTFAVIEEKATRKQRLFSVGDEVASASVEMILREKVVLGVNGKKEILKIERVKGRGGAVAARHVSGAPRATSEASGSGPKDGKELVIQRSRIEDAIQNVNQLMKHVRIRPHFTNGEPDGLKLTGVRPGSIFTEIGFRNGDIITGVNGKQIESVDDALKFYTSLKNASNVDLQIRRRGLEKSIQYRVED